MLGETVMLNEIYERLYLKVRDTRGTNLMLKHGVGNIYICLCPSSSMV